MSRANQLTTNVIRLCTSQGCKVWRNNTVGIFDATKASNRIWTLVQSIRVTTKEIMQTLKSCYLTSSDQKGASDILGCTPTGRMIAVEIKAKGDQLDKDKNKPFQQENFLKEIGQKGGLAFIVAEEPDKIRLRVMGSEKYICICTELEFLPLLIQKIKQPYA